jgi:hypothetical protein
MIIRSFYNEDNQIYLDSETLELANDMVKDWNHYPDSIKENEKQLFIAELLTRVKKRWEEDGNRKTSYCK